MRPVGDPDPKAEADMDDIVRQRLDSSSVNLDLPFSPESAAIARRQLVEWMRLRNAREERRDEARLVMSELVGNAVRHARPLADGTMQVAWAQSPSGIDIAVSDGGARTSPERVEAGASALSGRGLAIVEVLADRWWVESTRAGTTVHALVTLA